MYISTMSCLGRKFILPNPSESWLARRELLSCSTCSPSIPFGRLALHVFQIINTPAVPCNWKVQIYFVVCNEMDSRGNSCKSCLSSSAVSWKETAGLQNTTFLAWALQIYASFLTELPSTTIDYQFYCVSLIYPWCFRIRMNRKVHYIVCKAVEIFELPSRSLIGLNALFLALASQSFEGQTENKGPSCRA